MVFNCLKLSGKYSLDYIEIDNKNRVIPLGYQFYFFNYHPSTLGWIDTAKLKKLNGLIITMVLEVLPNDPFVMCPDNHFDGYCVLDPTLKSSNKKVFAFPRPLDSLPVDFTAEQNEIPVIGSFGFATRGKGFQHVVAAVNKEFDKALIRINIPFGDFVPDSEKYAHFLGELCKKTAKEGIEVDITHKYMSKNELIEWCSKNTLNCFLYDRDLPGLAATTDQAILSGRPLSVSDNETFRHIHQYLPSYPKLSLKESIDQSVPWVKQMQHDWSPRVFCSIFENMLEKLYLSNTPRKTDHGFFDIPILENNFLNRINKRFRKYKRYIKFQKWQYKFSKRKKLYNEELI
jgi:hypothetical protein